MSLLHKHYLKIFWQQLSQFWYDEETTEKLAKEVIAAAGLNGR